ncbi:hypothetical protein BT63DRAFT_455029 [Microthyrium microscopicum]|uniref:Uncharacterized protein n=1 Tax=Microthyrium microscopicum TaxID=703497 RepID=A0A6A6UCF5_9PEZI|nr:hypothetical protein BT63DRAFT_455029 [Microthyrium microscopicum]
MCRSTRACTEADLSFLFSHPRARWLISSLPGLMHTSGRLAQQYHAPDPTLTSSIAAAAASYSIPLHDCPQRDRVEHQNGAGQTQDATPTNESQDLLGLGMWSINITSHDTRCAVDMEPRTKEKQDFLPRQTPMERFLMDRESSWSVYNPHAK